MTSIHNLLNHRLLMLHPSEHVGNCSCEGKGINVTRSDRFTHDLDGGPSIRDSD